MGWSENLKSDYEREVNKASVYLRVLGILNESPVNSDENTTGVSTLKVLQDLDELKAIDDQEIKSFLTLVRGRLEEINQIIGKDEIQK